MATEIHTETTYRIDDDGRQVNEDLAVHREVGDSEFDYVLVGSNPDGGSEMVAFGFHESEIVGLPLPEEEA